MIRFSPVYQKHDNVLIIGGGESLKGFDFDQLLDFSGRIIVVNNVIFHVPRADYWMTVDPSKNRRPQKAMMKKRDGTYYFCAQPKVEEWETPEYHRRWYPEVHGIHYLERISNGDYSLQEDKTKITTGDSIYGALGLAYHMEAKKIAVLGLDVKGFGHWYNDKDPYNGHNQPEEKFNTYKENLKGIFRSCLPQIKQRGIEIVNGSPESTIDAFPKMTPQEAYNFLTD
jgi:hypothetical protein